MNEPGEAATAGRADQRPLRLGAIIAVLFVLAFANLFLRSSLGVMAPDLAREMALSPMALSVVASAFFFSYAVMQLPTGMLLDRFGARRTLAGMLLFTTAGAAAFAAAGTVGTLSLGRVLMGLGCAGVFTGAFYVLAQWLPQARVVTLMGTLNTFAASGTLAATTPLAAMIATMGWRDSYSLFTAGVALLLLAIWLIVRDAPPGSPPPLSRSEGLAGVLQGVGEAIRQPGMVRLLPTGLAISSASTITGLWGAPYLRHVHGLDTVGAGNVLLAMAVSAMAGHTALSLIARRCNSVKAAMVLGMAGVSASTSALALLDHPPLPAVACLFCLMGFSASFPMIVFAHARGLVPAHLMGRGLSAANMGLMTAIALMQLAFGWIVGVVSGSADVPTELAYRAGFAAQAGVAVLALVVYLPIADVRPRG